jgi:hypothetical protein
MKRMGQGIIFIRSLRLGKAYLGLPVSGRDPASVTWETKGRIQCSRVLSPSCESRMVHFEKDNKAKRAESEVKCVEDVTHVHTLVMRYPRYRLKPIRRSVS